jgi:cytidylate kinase
MNKNKKFLITINREVGSGGRTVGRKLAEKLQVKYCDKAVIEGLT